MIGLMAAVLATVTWSPPTNYTNGEPLPLDHIESYTAYASGLGEFFITTDTTITIDTIPGYQCFAVQVTTTNGLSSVWYVGTSWVCQDIPGDGPPSEPVLVCP